jgi:hypothetical protein
LYIQQIPADGQGLGWRVNISYAWRGTSASELLCEKPQPFARDFVGNSYNGTLILAMRGTCPDALKAANAKVIELTLLTPIAPHPS